MINESISKCLFCGKDAELRYSKMPGYQEPNVFNIYYCPFCNTSYSLPKVDTTKIYDTIYKKGKKVPGYDRYWDFVKRIKRCHNPLLFLSKEEEAYWAVKESLSKIVKEKESTTIVEIGSGLGYLTYSLKCDHYNIIGLDISQAAVQQARKNFGNHYVQADLYAYTQENAASFDVVILTEVIEHIETPLDFLESIKQLLKPGGYAIITTPNKSFYPADVVWGTEQPPVHCWWFSEDSMLYAAKSKNMNIEWLDFSQFYRNKPLVLDLYPIKKGFFHQPTLDTNGELINKNRYLISWLRIRIGRILILNKAYNYYKKLTLKEQLNCGTKGKILCAIMQKSTDLNS